jgi:hypothetical protein
MITSYMAMSWIAILLVLCDVVGGAYVTDGHNINSNSFASIAFANGTIAWAAPFNNGADLAAMKLAYSADAGRNWVATDFPRSTDGSLVSGTYKALGFSSPRFGMVAGTSARFFRTSDYGCTWIETIGAPPTNDVHLLDDCNWFRAEAGGAVSKSSDGGAAWVVMSSTLLQAANAIHFWTASTGVVGGSPNSGGSHGLYKTIDGGSNWMPKLADITIKDIDFYDASVGYAITADTLFSTTDGGDSWSAGTAIGASGCESVAASGASKVLIVCGNSQLAMSEDQGATVTVQAVSTLLVGQSIDMVDEHYGAAAFYSGSAPAERIQSIHTSGHNRPQGSDSNLILTCQPGPSAAEDFCATAAPTAAPTAIGGAYVSVSFGIGTKMACDGESVKITWLGNYNLQETSGPGCDAPSIGDPIAGYQASGHEQIFTNLGAQPGQTRFFKSDTDCANARIELSCASATQNQLKSQLNPLLASDTTMDALQYAIAQTADSETAIVNIPGWVASAVQEAQGDDSNTKKSKSHQRSLLVSYMFEQFDNVQGGVTKTAFKAARSALGMTDVTKDTVRVLRSNQTFDILSLPSAEAMYAPLQAIGDYVRVNFYTSAALVTNIDSDNYRVTDLDGVSTVKQLGDTFRLYKSANEQNVFMDVTIGSVSSDGEQTSTTSSTNSFWQLDSTHDVVVTRQTCPISIPTIAVSHLNNLSVAHFASSFGTLPSDNISFSSINVQGARPAYVSESGGFNVFTSVTDFAVAQSMENFVRLRTQTAQGLRVDCRADDGTAQLVNSSMSAVYDDIMAALTANTRLFRIAYNGSHYTGYTCATGVTRCTQTNACTGSVDAELVVLNSTQLDRDTVLAHPDNVTDADFQLFLFSYTGTTSPADITTVPKEDASFSRGALIDPFIAPVWDATVNALVVTRQGSTPPLYHVDMGEPNVRVLQIHQSDVNLAASLARRVLDDHGQNANTSFLTSAYGETIEAVHVIMLGITPHFVIDSTNGQSMNPTVRMDLSRGATGVSVDGSIQYISPLAQDSVTELPVQWAIVDVNLPHLASWSDMASSVLDGSGQFGSHVDMQHIATQAWVGATHDGKVHKRSIVSLQDDNGVPLGVCIANDFLSTGSAFAPLDVIGFNATTGVTSCEGDATFGLVMTVVEGEGILVEGVHLHYKAGIASDATVGGVTSAFGNLAKSTLLHWQFQGGSYVATSGHITYPVLASHFDSPVIGESYSHAMTIDDTLVAKGALGENYPVDATCPEDPSVICTHIGLADDACGGQRCGTIPYDVAYRALTSMVWSDEYTSLAAGLQKSYFGYPGTRKITDHDLTSWPVVVYEFENGDVHFVASLGQSEAVAIDFTELESTGSQLTVGSQFSNGFRDALCSPQGGSFAKMTALQKYTDAGITSVSVSVNMSPLPDLTAVTFRRGHNLFVPNTKVSYDGRSLVRSVDWYGSLTLQLQLTTRQLFTNLPPHLPLIHTIELEVESVESPGTMCQWTGYHEVYADGRSMYTVTPEAIERNIQQIYNGEFLSVELLDGRAVAFKAENSDGNLYWETSTLVNFVLVSSGACEGFTQFTNARLTQLDYSFHSAIANDYMNYTRYVSNETTVAYIDGVQSGTDFGHTVQLSGVQINTTSNEAELVGISPSLTTVMATRQFLDVPVGPLPFDMTPGSLDDRAQVSLEYMQSLAKTTSFVHGFALTNSSCPKNTLGQLGAIKYMDGMPHRNFDNYATEILNNRAYEWLNYNDMSKHPSSTFSTWPKGDCVQAYQIEDVLGHSGSSSNFLVSTTELFLESFGLSGYEPTTQFAYAVACLVPRDVDGAFGYLNTTGDDTISVLPVDSVTSACTEHVDMCDAGELTVHLRAGTRQGKVFMYDQMCIDNTFKSGHFDIHQNGEICNTDFFTANSESNLMPICADTACTTETVDTMTCNNSQIRAFEYEYGTVTEGVPSKHFKIDSDGARGTQGGLRLTTITVDLGVFARVATQVKVKSFYQLALQRMDQTRRFMLVSESSHHAVVDNESANRRLLQTNDDDQLDTAGTTTQNIVAIPDCDSAALAASQTLYNGDFYCPLRVCNGTLSITDLGDETAGQSIVCNDETVFILAPSSTSKSNKGKYISAILLVSINFVVFVGYVVYKLVPDKKNP